MTDTPVQVVIGTLSAVYRRGMVAILEEHGMRVLPDVGQHFVYPVAADVIIQAAAAPAQSDAGIPVLALLGSPEPAALHAALRSGAAGVELIDARAQELVSATQAVAAGDGWISPRIARDVIGLATFGVEQGAAHGGPERALTEREVEVLVLVAGGLSNRGVAAKLFISENTVKNHVRNMLRKLELTSRVDAATYAVSAGLVDSSQHR